MATLTTGTATRKHASPKRGHVVSMHIRRAANGVTVSTHHEMPPASKQQAMAGYMDHSSVDTVHTKLSSLKKHVADSFGDLVPDVGVDNTDPGDAAQQSSVPMG